MNFDNLDLRYLVVFSGVAGAGIGFKGLFILDEIFLIYLVLFILFVKPIRFVKVNKNYIPYVVIIMILLIYALIPVADVYASYHIFLRHFYGWFCLLCFLIVTKFSYYKNDESDLKRLKALNFVLFIYFVATLVQGAIAEVLIGTYSYAGSAGIEITGVKGRFYSQGIWWTGSAYFSIAALLNLIILVKTPINPIPNVAIIILTSIYFDSRTLLIMALLFLPSIIISSLSSRKAIIPMVSLALSFIVFISYNSEYVIQVINSAIATFAVNPRDSDGDRLLHLLASFDLMNNSPFSFLFGNGWQSHKYQLPDVINNGAILVRSTGLAAIIADLGLTGMIILLVLFIALLRKFIWAYGELLGLYLCITTTFFLLAIMYVTYPWDSTIYMLMLFGYFIPPKRLLASEKVKLHRC